MNGAETRSAAQMGDDNPADGQFRRLSAERPRDVVVRQTVEAVSPDTGVVEFSRQREPGGRVGLAVVERRVEACHLRKVRVRRRQRPNRHQIVRLVQRRERRQRFEFAQNDVVDHDGRAETRAAMHHPVASRDEFAAGGVCADPVHQFPKQDGLVAAGGLEAGQGLAGSGAGGKFRAADVGSMANSGDLAFERGRTLGIGNRPNGELDAR